MTAKTSATTSATDLTTLLAALGASAETAKVSVRVPTFWPDKPAVWFAQVEAQFTLSNITSDSTKYFTVVANLDATIICELEDIISNPPETNKYDKLKFELIKRLSASQEKRYGNY